MGSRVDFTEAKESGTEISSLRHINKAMTMELLIALLLTWLDQAGRVISGCCVKAGLPNYYSPQGTGRRITALYDDTDNQPAFHVVGEVSVRRKVTPSRIIASN